MSKRKILEIYDQLGDSEKKTIVQRINSALETSFSPEQMRLFLQQGRLFKKDFDKIYSIVSEYSKKKQLRAVVQGKPRKTQISSLMTSFLRPSQIGKMTRASTGAYRTFYESTAPTLQKIDTSNIRYPQQLIKKLPLFTSLKELDLSEVHLTGNSIRDLVASLEKLSKLEILNLHNKQISGENALLVIPAISNLKVLKLLDLSLNNYGLEGAIELEKVLPKLKSLQKLVLYDSEIDDQGAIAIANGIRPLRQLRCLDMELNRYGVEGTRAIVSALDGKENFEELYLGDEMDDECAQLVAHGMRSWKNLMLLKLENAIGNEGAYHLSKSFRFTPKLKVLSLSEFLGDTAGRNMSSWTSNLKYLSHLKNLELAVNAIGPESILSLVAAFPHLAQLKILNLSNNELWNEGINTLAENIHLLPKLNNLDISHTQCGSEGAHSLALALAPMIGRIEKINIKNNNLSDASKISLEWLFDDKIEV